MYDDVIEVLKAHGIIKSMCQNISCHDDPATCTCSNRAWEVNWHIIKDSVPRVMSMCYWKQKGDKTPYIYLGEIINMPGHGIFVEHKTGNVLSGYHIDDFEEVPEEEV